MFLPRISPILSHSSHKQAHQFSQTTSNRKCSKHGQSGNDKNMFSQNLITFILFCPYLGIWHSFFSTLATRTSWDEGMLRRMRIVQKLRAALSYIFMMFYQFRATVVILWRWAEYELTMYRGHSLWLGKGSKGEKTYCIIGMYTWKAFNRRSEFSITEA